MQKRKSCVIKRKCDDIRTESVNKECISFVSKDLVNDGTENSLSVFEEVTSEALSSNRNNKKKKSKIIKVSLSKPPSPETIQVIRVDVVSNFSVELEDEEEEQQDEKEKRKNVRKEFLLKCNKLPLVTRS